MGDKITYDNLTISFLVDEHLENYISLRVDDSDRISKSRSQFSEFRSTTSNTPTTTQGISRDIGEVKASTER